jgi:hypothetical protein
MKIIHKNDFFILLFDDLIKQRIFRILTDRQFIAIEYLIMTKKWLNLNQPRTFTEKIQWIKVYGHLEKFTQYVDKIAVRKFVKKTIGDSHFVPLLGTWEKFSDIDFDKLPSRFVLKATHGSAYVFVCQDKSSLDLKALEKKVNKWLSENFYYKTREKQYKDIKPRIIAEKYLEDENGELIDYKIFCYDGQPRFIEVVWGRFTDNKGDVYKDLNWKTLDIGYVGFPYSKRKLFRPKNLEALLEIARKLSKPFTFVRVDLYSVKNKIYFGEITFTPGNGMERFDPPESDYQLGEFVDLTKYNSQLKFSNN